MLKTTIKHAVSPKYAYLRRFAVGRGDVVIDLGANVGEVSEYFLNRGADVHAYEPNPHASAVLLRRLGRRKNLRFYPEAVSDFAGRSKLYLHRDHEGAEVEFSQAGSLRSEKKNLCDDFIEVPVADIREVLGAHDRIALLKIDIEGGEYDIMDEVLRQIGKIDHVLLETHEKKSEAFKQKNDLLLENIARAGAGAKIYTDWF